MKEWWMERQAQELLQSYIWLADRAKEIRCAKGWTKKEKERSWKEWEVIYASTDTNRFNPAR